MPNTRVDPFGMRVDFTAFDFNARAQRELIATDRTTAKAKMLQCEAAIDLVMTEAASLK